VPVVPTRESLHTGGESRLGEGGLQPRNTDRFFTRKQPPAAAPAFHEQANQVQRVMQGHIGNAQAPNAGGRGAEGVSNTGREGANGQRGLSAGGNAEHASGQETSRRPQGNAEDNNSGSHDRGGWTKFSPPSGRGNDTGRSSRDNIAVPRGNGGSSGRSNSGPGATRSAPSNEDHGGFRRFPGGGSSQPTDGPGRRDTGPSGGSVDRGGGDRGNIDRGNSERGNSDRGNDGWQHFPSNSGQGSRGNDNAGPGRDRSDHSSGPSGKPLLELNKPIVTPRGSPEPSPTRSPEMRNERGGPDIRNERGGPPSSSRGGEARGGGYYGGGRERSSGGRERSSGGGGGHERGGGGGAGDRGSKSSSGPKSR